MVLAPGRINILDMCGIQDDPYGVREARVNMQAIKDAGFEGVYLKSSQYSKTKDFSFQSLRDRAWKAGLAVGAYHFCSHDTEPEPQAEYFYRQSEGLGQDMGDLPPMIDWEFCTPSKYNPHPFHCVNWLERMAKHVTELWYPGNIHRKCPRLPVLYTYPNYAATHQPALQKSVVGIYPLCLASYKSDSKGKLVPWLPKETDQPFVEVPQPWAKWTLWQYSGNNGAPVPGVPGDCDRQVFYGSQGDWAEFRGLVRPVHQSTFEVKDG